MVKLERRALPIDGSLPMEGELGMGTHKVTDVVDPGAAQDAATKNYVDGLSGLNEKSGSLPDTDFSGTPLKATVTFNTPFGDANYSVAIIGVDSRVWSIENKAAGSFDINSNSNTALTVGAAVVDWHASPHRDP